MFYDVGDFSLPPPPIQERHRGGGHMLLLGGRSSIFQGARSLLGVEDGGNKWRSFFTIREGRRQRRCSAAGDCQANEWRRTAEAARRCFQQRRPLHAMVMLRMEELASALRKANHGLTSWNRMSAARKSLGSVEAKDGVAGTELQYACVELHMTRS